jgi:hypothetical protein
MVFSYEPADGTDGTLSKDMETLVSWGWRDGDGDEDNGEDNVDVDVNADEIRQCVSGD